MRHVRRHLVLVLGVVVVLAGCGGGSKKPSQASTSTSAGASTTLPAQATPAPDPELAAKLVSTVPEGFAQQPDRPGLIGPIDLAKAVRDDGSPDGEAALKSSGFERGYVKVWINPAGDKILDYVYQHATDAGAQQLFDRLKGLAGSRAPTGSQPLAVPGMPPSSIGLSGVQEGTPLALVLFRTGRYVVQVICDGKVAADVQARVAPVAQEQLQRLS
jgi:hypothetical protein